MSRLLICNIGEPGESNFASKRNTIHRLPAASTGYGTTTRIWIRQWVAIRGPEWQLAESLRGQAVRHSTQPRQLFLFATCQAVNHQRLAV